MNDASRRYSETAAAQKFRFGGCPKVARLHSVASSDLEFRNEKGSTNSRLRIEDCRSKHKACRESQNPRWLPTRLVDIGEYDSGYVRVVDSSTLSKGRDRLYLALSHCWGRQPFLVMNKRNKKGFERGIFSSYLAPNFQDAMFITRQLGFRYIWIDSLCIIQGSRKDWAREAPSMNKVYRNAFLTIGAMASSDARGGLFRARDPGFVGACPAMLRMEDGDEVECLLVKSDFWESNVREAPLNQRAWVLQERILAPRSVYFCESQLFWECREQQACELFPVGIPKDFMTDVNESELIDAVSVKGFEAAVKECRRTSTGVANEGGGPSSSRARYDYAYQVWNDVLQLYTRCSLTKPSDKLIAISGVAKDFAIAIGDEYLAGLWRRNLINGLLWTTGSQIDHGFDKVPSVRPRPWRAPSWSWACLDAPFTTAYDAEYDSYGDFADASNVHIEPKGDDPTGELRHACLQLCGFLVRTRRKPTRHADGWHFGTFFPDTEEFTGDEFYCVPLREVTIGSETWLTGLVLTPCLADEKDIQSCCRNCSDKDMFRRVGVFETDLGDPIKYLGMKKPRDWKDWGDESDHTWFSTDAGRSEFVII